MNNPDRLLIFIDNGKVRYIAAQTLSFEYSFDLQVIFIDFAGHPDSVMLHLFGWLSVHQSELLENLSKAADGIQFKADILEPDFAPDRARSVGQRRLGQHHYPLFRGTPTNCQIPHPN